MTAFRFSILLLISVFGLPSLKAAETIYFLVGNPRESDWKLLHDAYVLPLSGQEDISYARYLLALGRSVFDGGHATIVGARIAPGKDNINRNYVDPTFPEWSWHVSEFLGFYDLSAEILDGSPTDVEIDPEWYQGTDARQGVIGFWSYTVVRELGPHPLFLSIVPENEELHFYWSGLGTNAVYTLEAKDTLTGTDWSPVSGASWPLETNEWVLASTDAGIQCYRVRAERQEATQGPEESLSFRTLDHGAFSGLTEATNLVIRTEAGWRDLWEKHSGLGVPVKAVPEVNFEKEMVVAVITGPRGTSGYEVEVKRIVITSSRLKVFVERTTPAPDDLVLTVLTAPFHFVAVRKSELKPEFVGVEAE